MEKGKDRASKLYFSDPERAREIVRLALKRMGVNAELTDLTIEDPVVSFMDTKISIEKLLDKLYKITLSNDESSTFCLMGLENQSKFDAHMLIRAGITSLLIYDWKLSLKEELKPVFIVVLNMSEGEWKGPTRLEDYFSKEDLELLGPLMVNVRMLVIDPHGMGEEEMDGLKTDLDLVLKVIKYKSDKDAFCGYISSEERFKKLDEVTAKLVAELINVDMDGEDGNVCKAIEDLINDSKEEGRIEGEVNAIYKLRRDGILNLDVAADRLGLSLEEYNKREERFFS
ncbi:MAG: Rpn family recombination-promoting nuclease/putative transposase [Spirochaetales bacterium]|nr:Rpn family recombination-promoting nuclease/putative transposase [Spirochaetales bacterium]